MFFHFFINKVFSIFLFPHIFETIIFLKQFYLNLTKILAFIMYLSFTVPYFSCVWVFCFWLFLHFYKRNSHQWVENFFLSWSFTPNMFRETLQYGILSSFNSWFKRVYLIFITKHFI